MRKPPEPLRCRERIRMTSGEEVHPGWVRATAILLRGMERLKAHGQVSADTNED